MLAVSKPVVFYMSWSPLYLKKNRKGYSISTPGSVVKWDNRCEQTKIQKRTAYGLLEDTGKLLNVPDFLLIIFNVII